LLLLIIRKQIIIGRGFEAIDSVKLVNRANVSLLNQNLVNFFLNSRIFQNYLRKYLAELIDMPHMARLQLIGYFGVAFDEFETAIVDE
jgi:hypothetical protein